MEKVRRGAWGIGARFGVVMAAALLAAGCGGGQPAQPPADSTASQGAPAPPSGNFPDSPEPGTPVAQGQLAPPERAGDAFTYNAALAPEGTQMSVYVAPNGSSTRVRLDVEGLLPDRGYAAHAHANACGATGDAAGPHFQNRPDPAAGPGRPSTDPAYANPQNEVWLDLRTDENGNGTATAEVPFAFSDRAPASVVIHEAMMTATEAGKAGTAGGRLACLTAPFK